jgi:acyl-ACP thioesterase
LTAKITNFKIIKSGVAEIQHFQAREYSTRRVCVVIAPDINSQMNLKNKIKNLQQLQPKSSQSIKKRYQVTFYDILPNRGFFNWKIYFFSAR